MKTIEEMRARLAEILNLISKFEDAENYSDEQLEELTALNTEFESLKKNIEAKQKIEAAKASMNLPEARKVPAQKVVTPEAKGAKSGFKNGAEFFHAVRATSKGKFDPRFQNTMFEKNGEDGGFLVPEEFMSNIAKKLGGDESLLARTSNFNVAGNSLSLPTDETQPWNGGVAAYWTAEGATITDSKHKFGQASWKLHKLAAIVKVTDELLEDSTALESYINMVAPEAIMHKVNSAILVGDGAGKPLGIINSGFKYKVAKESMQTADTVNAKNVINMYSRLIPSSRTRAAWYINAAVEPQLRTMTDDNGNYIYLAPGSQMNQTPYGLLLGLPVIPLMGSMPALGDEGDIILADLSYYYTIQKSGGIQSAISAHVYFEEAIQAFRFTFRIDGSCPFKSPVTTENGSYSMSAFITLEAR